MNSFCKKLHQHEKGVILRPQDDRGSLARVTPSHWKQNKKILSYCILGLLLGADISSILPVLPRRPFLHCAVVPHLEACFFYTDERGGERGGCVVLITGWND